MRNNNHQPIVLGALAASLMVACGGSEALAPTQDATQTMPTEDGVVSVSYERNGSRLDSEVVILGDGRYDALGERGRFPVEGDQDFRINYLNTSCYADAVQCRTPDRLSVRFEPGTSAWQSCNGGDGENPFGDSQDSNSIQCWGEVPAGAKYLVVRIDGAAPMQGTAPWLEAVHRDYDLDVTVDYTASHTLRRTLRKSVGVEDGALPLYDGIIGPIWVKAGGVVHARVDMARYDDGGANSRTSLTFAWDDEDPNAAAQNVHCTYESDPNDVPLQRECTFFNPNPYDAALYGHLDVLEIFPPNDHQGAFTAKAELTMAYDQAAPYQEHTVWSDDMEDGDVVRLDGHALQGTDVVLDIRGADAGDFVAFSVVGTPGASFVTTDPENPDEDEADWFEPCTLVEDGNVLRCVVPTRACNCEILQPGCDGSDATPLWDDQPEEDWATCQNGRVNEVHIFVKNVSGSDFPIKPTITFSHAPYEQMLRTIVRDVDIAERGTLSPYASKQVRAQIASTTQASLGLRSFSRSGAGAEADIQWNGASRDCSGLLRSPQVELPLNVSCSFEAADLSECYASIQSCSVDDQGEPTDCVAHCPTGNEFACAECNNETNTLIASLQNDSRERVPYSLRLSYTPVPQFARILNVYPERIWIEDERPDVRYRRWFRANLYPTSNGRSAVRYSLGRSGKQTTVQLHSGQSDVMFDQLEPAPWQCIEDTVCTITDDSDFLFVRARPNNRKATQVFTMSAWFDPWTAPDDGGDDPVDRVE